MPASLVWSTPDGENLIAYMARVSNPDNQDNLQTAPRLIQYLVDNQHWSPFEMVGICIEIECPRDIGRQLLRHRSFTFQEFSQRYADVTKLPVSETRQARLQDTKNRQNSLVCEDAELVAWWEAEQLDLRLQANHLYTRALNKGLAKECARAVLPEGLTTSRMYMYGTLRSWMHFYRVRTHPGAQQEIKDLAEKIGAIIEPLYPVSWRALTQ